MKKKTGCSIMSDRWTNKKNIIFVTFWLIILKGKGRATMGHKRVTAPLTFYKHVYVQKYKLGVGKSHD
jgi:DNA/RNA endonuclease G (NUC1)